jgi:hypothetical protein
MVADSRTSLGSCSGNSCCCSNSGSKKTQHDRGQQVCKISIKNEMKYQSHLFTFAKCVAMNHPDIDSPE